MPGQEFNFIVNKSPVEKRLMVNGSQDLLAQVGAALVLAALGAGSGQSGEEPHVLLLQLPAQRLRPLRVGPVIGDHHALENLNLQIQRLLIHGDILQL